MIASAVRPTATLPEAVRLKLAQIVATGKLELPVLSEVATQVVQLCSDEGADPKQLALVVRRDQAMAGNLMKVANSAMYSQGAALVSLDQVVSRLGMKKVREIALIISCQNKVFAVPGYEIRIRAMFCHSLAAAAFAQEIARIRRWNVEEAFLAGLLHDVGRPLLIQTLLDLARTEGVVVDDAGIDGAGDVLHARVGSELVKSWALPVRLSDAILNHHNPDKSLTAKNLAYTTALADDLAHLLLGPRSVSPEGMRTHPLNVPLNIYPEEMDALLAKSDAIKAQVEALG